jgi:exodeoxyribonuclease-3
MLPEKTVRLVSWNVNGLRAVIRKNFFLSVRQLGPDILSLQETKLQDHQITDEMTDFEDFETHWSSSVVKKGYSGVATYSRLTPISVKKGIGVPDFDDEGRILETDFGDFILFNVYFPNGQMSEERLQYKLRFFSSFFEYTDKLKDQGRNIVVAGDFNIAHNEIDLKHPKANENTSGFLRIERDVMDSIVERGYVDTFRYFNPDTVKYSWWSYRAGARRNNAGWRIDYFLVSRSMIEKKMVKEPYIDNTIQGSDHCPVGLVLSV